MAAPLNRTSAVFFNPMENMKLPDAASQGNNSAA